jgi:hypothetical protein
MLKKAIQEGSPGLKGPGLAGAGRVIVSGSLDDDWQSTRLPVLMQVG